MSRRSRTAALSLRLALSMGAAAAQKGPTVTPRRWTEDKARAWANGTTGISGGDLVVRGKKRPCGRP